MCARARVHVLFPNGHHHPRPRPPPRLESYPLVMMLQCGQKLKLDAQTFVGAQLQDRQFRSLQVEDAGWRAEGGEGPQLQIKDD